MLLRASAAASLVRVGVLRASLAGVLWASLVGVLRASLVVCVLRASLVSVLPAQAYFASPSLCAAVCVLQVPLRASLVRVCVLLASLV